MAYYRLYYFGGPSGRIDHFREFEAPHDAAAIMQCGEWRSINPMELWSGRRKVMRWDEVSGSRYSRCLPVSAFWHPPRIDRDVCRMSKRA